MWIFHGTKILRLLLIFVVIEVSEAQAVEHDNSVPLRVWGDISSAYRVREIDSGESTDRNLLNTGTINASSYVWRPWFALVYGSISASIDRSKFDEESTVKDEFTTGRAQFDLFPSSRFPFMLYYNEDRSKFDDDDFDLDVSNTEYGAEQKYRSLDGKQNYRGLYRRNRQDNSSDTEIVQDEIDKTDFKAERLMFSASNQFEQNSFGTDIDLDTVDEEVSGRQADIYSITATHSYRKATNLSLDNLLATSKIENDFSESSSDENSYQLNSFLSWQPLTRNDIRLTASLRMARNRIAQNETLQGLRSDVLDNEISTANVSQGLIYEYSDNLLLSESVNANFTQAQDDSVQSIGSESLKATYIADRIALDLGDYGWSASTSFSNQHGDTESSQELNNQLGHSLANNRSVKNNYELRTNLTQSFRYEFDTSEQDETGIDHAFTLTWSDISTTNQSMISFTASDSRTTGENDDMFQLINLQYTGGFRFSRYSRLAGNLTLQRTNQENDGLRSERTVTNGQLEYSRNRFFQVPNLILRSKLRLEQRLEDRDSFTQDLSDDSEIDGSWENSIRHSIGRLETRFSIDFIVHDDRYDRLIKFELKRSFGDL